MKFLKTNIFVIVLLIGSALCESEQSNESLTQNLNEKFENLTNQIQDLKHELDKTKADLLNTHKLIETFKYADVLTSSMYSGSGHIADAVASMDLNKISLDELIPAIYRKNWRNVENMIEMLNLFTNVDDQIHGYRLLFDEMRLRGNQYSVHTTTIAFLAEHVFKTIRPFDKNLQHIQENLPESLKVLPWNHLIEIFNVKFSERVFASNNSEHLLVTTREFFEKHVDAWKILPHSNGTSFQLLNNYYQQSMYVDKKNSTTNDQLYNVYIGENTENILNANNWQFEPIKDSNFFKIKNIKLNEYLTIDDNFQTINDHIIFTVKSQFCNTDNCKWKISRRPLHY